jgi:tyrosinase
MSDTTAATRYGRVKQILDDAAKGSTADYGIGCPPWQLPLRRFTAVEVYGVRMIAPEKPSPSECGPRGCGCGCTGQDPDAAPGPLSPGRGAASGLVKGLRGQAPYDGSVFPRLPWGGTEVSADDVQFISDWIDDGCPERDTLVTEPLERERFEVSTVRIEQVEPAVIHCFEEVAGSGNEHRRRQGEVRQRVNLDCMGCGELQKLRDAFRELYSLNKWQADRRNYNNLALIHQDHCQHGWERFLPWHRVYLYEFELALQEMVPDVTLPYWDWTMPQYRPETPEKGDIIPRAYKLTLTRTWLDWLVDDAVPSLPAAEAEHLGALLGTPFTSLARFFAAARQAGLGAEYTMYAHRKRFIDAFLGENPLWYPLRYPAEYHDGQGRPGTINEIIHYHYPRPEDMREILSLRTFRDFGGGGLYNDSFGFLDQNPHNTMHLWTGGMNPDTARPQSAASAALTGDPGRSRNRGVRAAGRRFHTRDDMYAEQENGDMLSNLTASYDPIFWPIHVNVDRTWWEWQQLNPAGVPADLDGVLTPWSYTVRDTLDIAPFGYEYVKSSSLIRVGSAAPVGRFVSRPVEVPRAVASGFRSAEVRLHRVPQLERSCFVRVFLNLPDADASTPVTHARYAGYLAIFGHGECVGGPGHCAVPERGRYDLRPRSHNTPRNHRVNVTRAARELIDAGATTLQITLVTVGVDYREDADLLRLEGVSLNFLD